MEVTSDSNKDGVSEPKKPKGFLLKYQTKRRVLRKGFQTLVSEKREKDTAQCSEVDYFTPKWKG